MNAFILLLSLAVSLAESAPLYGENGGYQGFASYTPLKNSLSRTGSEDSIKASAGSPEIRRRPSKSSSTKVSNNLPKKYNVLDYIPSHQHGYGSNKVSEEIPDSPYHRATIYGQENGGYKIADSYPTQQVEEHNNKIADSYPTQQIEDHNSKIADSYPTQQVEDHGNNEQKYSGEDYSNPQPYEYGYSLSDEHGNSQHKHETSDGHGNVKGAYGFMDEHGLYRSVEYVAGKDGFKAFVKTNEPGTESQNPADVLLQAEDSSESK